MKINSTLKPEQTTNKEANVEHKFAVGTRIRLTRDVLSHIPYMRKGSVGIITGYPSWIHDRGLRLPVYTLTMNIVNSFDDPDDLDQWFVLEDALELES